ncbi:pentapeptide repeat-containing protein [Streptomyces californicus]|uniref:pentapeptide repeat-containing protein n=1 Tax=Streptomyces californicus TaxID=67351 RepID=UPI00369D35DE
MSTSEAPLWPHCAHGADPAADPVGCRGIHVSGYTACLAHLTDTDRDAYLASLTPGADIDHRGTTFTGPLLRALKSALNDPATSTTHFGIARFDSATFKGTIQFDSTTFEGDAWFRAATFTNKARFDSATFKSDVRFTAATFEHDARFTAATFEGDAWFRAATFENMAQFDYATFRHYARFDTATFEGYAVFMSVAFTNKARFDSATFKHRTRFNSATFEGYTSFRSATFERGAQFEVTTFKRGAQFETATFKGNAWFTTAAFERDARFTSATFEGDAHFEATTFERDARFMSATFKGDARFESTAFKGDARFDSATFPQADRVGPLVCAGRVVLSGAMFGGPVTLSLAARYLECRRTRWAATAELRLRYTTVDFAHAVFEYPLTIAAESDPFVLADGSELAEGAFAGAPGAGVGLASLRGVDAAHLVLADVDLSPCLFAGAVHLDQLRLEGACTFDSPPSPAGRRRWSLVRFTQRRVLAEEHHWRAGRAGAVRGWNVAVLGAGRVGPLQLAPVYRALRKAFEDGKHEPGAADFYYGEMGAA